MSFSLTGVDIEAGDFEIHNVFQELADNLYKGEVPVEVQDMLDCGVRCLIEMMRPLLKTVKTFSCGIVGHTNPGHIKVDGWSNDFVSVTCYVKEYLDNELPE